jgi:hypothetical protein
MTTGESDGLIVMVQKHGADALLGVVAIALKEKAGAAHQAGRHREAELLMEQAVILLDALPVVREIEERIDSVSLVPFEAKGKAL